MSNAWFDLDNTDTIFFACPSCGVQRQETKKDFHEQHDKNIVECPCGHSFKLHVDFRKYYRKKICLEGMYQISTHPQISGKMFVIDLSFSGCRIDASISHNLKVGDSVWLIFTINDAPGLMVKKEVVVRTVNEGYLGCEFIAAIGPYDRDLGFFLKP